MKIVICALSAILATVLIAGPFNVRGDGSDRDDPAGPREYPDAIADNQPAHESERQPVHESDTESRPEEQEALPLSAAPREEPTLAPQAQPRELADGWQIVRQRRPRVAPESEHGLTETDGNQLAREEFLERQTRELEAFLEMQQRQFDEFVAQQDRDLQEFLTQPEQASAAAGEDQREEFSDRIDHLVRNRDSQSSSGSGIRPIPDSDPGDVSYQGPYPEQDDVRTYEPVRRDTIEIPLPGRRSLRFRLP